MPEGRGIVLDSGCISFHSPVPTEAWNEMLKVGGAESTVTVCVHEELAPWASVHIIEKKICSPCSNSIEDVWISRILPIYSISSKGPSTTHSGTGLAKLLSSHRPARLISE